MGGSGSGPNGWRRKTTVEECRILDIGKLNREGCLKPGLDGRISWTKDEHELASIGWEYSDDKLRLLYTVTRDDDERQDYDDLFFIEWTGCHYGGKRPWFLCPGCSKRRTKLYMPPGRALFRCRECWDLNYTSSQVRRKIFDETAHKIRRLKSKLGDDGLAWDPVPPKPKNMHWETYAALAEEIRGLQDGLAAEMLAEIR